MPPSFVVNDLRYCLEADTELLGYFRQGSFSAIVGVTDDANLTSRKFRAAVALAPVCLGMSTTTIALTTRHQFRMGARTILVAFGRASLRCSVSHVIELCAGKQVRGVDANTVIAMVADEQPIRDRANGQLIGHPVRQMMLSLDRKCAISRRMLCAEPRPTSIGTAGHVYEFPKAVEGKPPPPEPLKPANPWESPWWVTAKQPWHYPDAYYWFGDAYGVSTG